MALDSSEKIWQKIQQGTFIIAEIGKNFIQSEEDQPVEVYLENAKKLVLAAKEAGADAVKFQTHNVEDEQMEIEKKIIDQGPGGEISFTTRRVDAPHFKGQDRFEWVYRNTTRTPVDKFWKPLKVYCTELGIIFFSTPMSRGAAEKLAQVGVDLWKVGSGDILDFAMLDFIRGHGAPIILSSGMSTLDEVDAAINFVRARTPHQTLRDGTGRALNIALLHCVSEYPCPPEKLHLRTIEFFHSRYNIPVGFSDHSLGYESAVAAVALGAKIIEKHFTFDRNFYGPDHKVGMLPQEFAEMTRAIRNVEVSRAAADNILNSATVKNALGAPVKIIQDMEEKFRPLFRKALVVAGDLPAGTVIRSEHLYAMRPQAYIKGLPSEKYEEVVGKKLTKDLKKYEPITRKALKQ